MNFTGPGGSPFTGTVGPRGHDHEAPGERRGGAHSGRRPHAGAAEAAASGPASASPKHSKDTLKAVKRHFAELIH